VDLGLTGRRAIVCASSRGLGFACANSLAREGVLVTLNGRDAESLSRARLMIEESHHVPVTSVVGNIMETSTQQALFEACPTPDILVNNNGGPAPGRFADWGRDDWIAALDANMLAPLAMIRLALDGMVERKFGRIVNITSNSVKAPIEELGLSNAARSGLTGFVAGLARKTIRHNVTINNILPGQFMTDRLKTRLTVNAKAAGQTLEQYLEARSKVIPAGRFGDPSEFGEMCAYVCSVQAAFITGQNFLIDGGTYPGTY
jgi:3-oxoacyl-[acyl-carrier protein] reductase